jgi:methionyl-tRNA synthetase
MNQLSLEQLLQNSLILFPLFIWMTIWKGIALWKSARNSHKKWFIFLFLLNTLGLLEIIYIFFFSKKVTKEKLK